jgi:hypothetical protein
VKNRNNQVTFFYDDKEIDLQDIKKVDSRLLSFGIHSIIILDASDSKNLPFFLELMGNKN